MPEDFKLHCHGIVEGRARGLSPEDAIAYADNKLAQYRSWQAKSAAATADPKTAE